MNNAWHWNRTSFFIDTREVSYENFSWNWTVHLQGYTMFYVYQHVLFIIFKKQGTNEIMKQHHKTSLSIAIYHLINFYVFLALKNLWYHCCNFGLVPSRALLIHRFLSIATKFVLASNLVRKPQGFKVEEMGQISILILVLWTDT